MSHAPLHRPLVAGLGAIAAFGLVAGVLTVPASAAQTPRGTGHSSFAELTVLPGSDADSGSDAPAMVSAPADRTLARPTDVSAQASDTTIARAHLEQIAPLWGIDNSASSLRAVSSSRALPAEPVVRFTQLVDGVPVYGGGLVVALDDSGGLRSVSGDVADADTDLDFTIGSESARKVARTAAASALDLPAARLRVGTAFRYAYDAELVGGTSTTVVPAWRVLVAGARGSEDKVEVLVDARNGHVLRTTGATPHVVDRAVCDGQNSFVTDASYGWCGQNTYIPDTGSNNVPYVRSDLTGASGVTDVEGAYQALTKTDTFYSTVLGYDLNTEIAPTSSTIGRSPADGPTLAAIVRYCDPEEYFRDNPEFPNGYPYGNSTWWATQLCPMPNAYWYADDLNYDPNGLAAYPGGQMFIGGGLGSATDVIAHEMTHGVTAASNALLYSGQSGAINESMSDVFGQLVQDYSNGATANSVDPAWLIGEDANAPGHGAFPAETTIVGAIHSMGNPAAFDQPAAMSSPLWATGTSDSGGVHTNSGVGNHTAYLIAHGGTGVTRLDQTSAVGSTAATVKVAHLYWAVQQVLSPNADYRMLGVKLDEQCRVLAASSLYGFTTADCDNSVDAALHATGMTGTSAAVSVAAGSVVYGKSVIITGKVTYVRGTGISGVPIQLQRQFKGTSTWSTIGTGTTSSSSLSRGTFSWSVKPFKSANYRTVYAGTGFVNASASSSRAITVTPTIGRTVKSTKIRVRTALKVSGAVRPGLSGRTIYLQQYVNRKWSNVAKVKLSSKSTYSLSYKPTKRAKRTFRMQLPASIVNNGATSSKFTVRII